MSDKMNGTHDDLDDVPMGEIRVRIESLERRLDRNVDKLIGEFSLFRTSLVGEMKEIRRSLVAAVLSIALITILALAAGLFVAILKDSDKEIRLSHKDGLSVLAPKLTP